MESWTVGFLDQVHAATAEAKAAFEAKRRYQTSSAGHDNICTAARVVCRWIDSFRTASWRCVHLASPAPCYGHANLPSQVWCFDCVDGVEAPWHCSLCGAESDYLQEGELLYGLTNLTFVVCTGCDE